MPQPVASGFGPVALKMEFKKMWSDPVAFCDRLQNRTGPDFKTLVRTGMTVGLDETGVKSHRLA